MITLISTATSGAFAPELRSSAFDVNLAQELACFPRRSSAQLPIAGRS